MPHKRKRSRMEQSQPKASSSSLGPAKKRAKRLKAMDGQERIPKELTRLLASARGIKTPSGLDDGGSLPSGGAGATSGNPATSTKTGVAGAQPDALRIRPGERLADYSARVDAALPISTVAKRGKLKIPGIRPYQSKLARRTQRMQDEWRREAAKIQEQREEAAQEMEDRLDEALPGVGARLAMFGSKSKEDDDPWADLGKARALPHNTSKGLTGLHDVVEAPPVLKPQYPKFKEKRHEGRPTTRKKGWANKQLP